MLLGSPKRTGDPLWPIRHRGHDAAIPAMKRCCHAVPRSQLCSVMGLEHDRFRLGRELKTAPFAALSEMSKPWKGQFLLEGKVVKVTCSQSKASELLFHIPTEWGSCMQGFYFFDKVDLEGEPRKTQKTSRSIHATGYRFKHVRTSVFSSIPSHHTNEGRRIRPM